MRIRTSSYDRARSVALALMVVIGGWLAIAGSAAAAPPAPKPRLLVVGDSIILGTGNNIAADLPDWDVTFDAAVSRSTEAGLTAVQQHGTDYQAVVIALGANDGGTPAVFAPRVAAILDTLRPVPHVVWLTIHEARPYYAQTNAIIREAVSTHPNAEVGDWNAAVKPGDVGEDGLHLTPQGSTDMATWVAGVVRAGVPPTTTTSTSTTTTSTTTSTTTTTTTIPEVSSLERRAGAPVNASAKQTDGSGPGPWIFGVVGLAVLAVATVAGLVVTARRSKAATATSPSDTADGDDPSRP